MENQNRIRIRNRGKDDLKKADLRNKEQKQTVKEGTNKEAFPQWKAAGKGFLTAWALLLVCGLGTDHILVLLFWAAAYVLYTGYRTEKAGRRMRAAAAGTSAVLTLLWLLGGMERITGGLENPAFRAAVLAAAGAGLFLMLQEVLLAVYLYRPDRHPVTTAAVRKSPVLPAFGICLLCWTPYWLANFPAVMTVDSLNQYAQAAGIYAYSNHHPWLHTLLIQLCLRAARFLGGTDTAGLALYTLLQMMLLAGCAACLIGTMERCGIRRKWQAAALAFYALLPFQGMFAVTVWKDILFAGVFLLFGLTLFAIQRTGMHGKESACYLISGCLVCLLRSNGWYAFLGSVPFLLFAGRRQMKKLLPATVLVIGLVMGIRGPVMDAFGVTQPDLAESLSVPLQQVAKVAASGRELTPEETVLIGRVTDREKIPEVFDRYCADNIKRLIRRKDPGYLETHPEEYRNLYVRIGCRYPAEYFQAWSDLTSAYWYPETGREIIFNEGIGENEFGLEGSSLFRGPVYLKLKEIFFKLYRVVPGYGLLFSPGAYTWLLIVLGGFCLARGRTERIVVLIPACMLVVTLMLASPLNGELRYAYAVIFCMPLYLLSAGLPEREG